ncbi:MAG: hypothetical protein NDI77_07605 [Geobacteraceae bacterium]|nr:hypothetical protein [Geobacteraceae bacterium]
MRRMVLCCIALASILLSAGQAQAIEGFPGKTWGEFRYEDRLDGGGIDNTLLYGWIEQGVYWFSWREIKLNTYGTVRYKWDEKGLDWNNSVGPGVGIALEKFFPKGAYVRGGAEFLWDRLYKSGESEQKAVLYVNWYGWWDLGRK